ncbi:MAG: hypothetical protein R3D03_10305 [Geminicoccaceae bacterium]
MEKDRKLVSKLAAHLASAVGHADGRLAAERQEIEDYYRGERPYRLHRGQSSFVSQEVHAAVETMHAQILETFSAARRMVHFTPSGPQDVEAARIATEYCAHVVFDRNHGERVFSSAIRDALKGRIGVTAVNWVPRMETVTVFEGRMQAVELAALEAQDPQIDTDGMDWSDETGLFEGVITKDIETGKVELAPVPPEDFLVSPRARSLDDAEFLTLRSWKTRAQLRAMGFSDRQLDDIQAVDGSGDSPWSPADQETVERFAAVDDGGLLGQSDHDRIELFDTFAIIDDEDGGKRWHIIWAGDTILGKEPVADHPFVTFVPIPVPHSLWGHNFARTVVSTQNAKTMLMRGVMDHTAITNNPRYLVKAKAISDPREVLENRLGGIINVQSPDAVTPMMQPQLNPFVQHTVAMLDADLETKIGISSLSQGVNKDAVSRQNSAALVEQLQSAGQTRQKIVAREFATGYLIPLYLKVYRLVIENADSESIVKVAGNWVPVDPREWAERTQMHAELRLGYGELDREVEKLMLIHQTLSADPMIAHLYGPEQRFNTLRRILNLQGIKDTDTYLTSPANAEPPQPGEAEVLALEAQRKQMELEERRMTLEERRFELEARIRLAEVQIRDGVALSNATRNEERSDLERDKFEHDQVVDMAEVEVMKRNAARTDIEHKSATIISPNS